MFNKHILLNNGQRIVGVYPMKEGVVFAQLPGTERIARVAWKGRYGDEVQSGQIDYFIVKDEGRVDSFLSPSQVERGWDNPVNRGFEKKFVLDYQIMNRFRELEPTIRAVTSVDIESHLNIKGAGQLLFDYVPRKENDLNPELKIDYVAAPTSRFNPTKGLIEKTRHANVIITGKQDSHEDCILDLNLDASTWCFSGITPEGFLAPWQRCLYCYASVYDQYESNKDYPIVWDINRKQLLEKLTDAVKTRRSQGKPSRYVRFGKMMDMGAPHLHDSLLQALAAMKKFHLSAIFPTKALTFYSDLADSLRTTGSSLLMSLDNDELSPGMVAHGMTQDERIRVAQEYSRRGVKTSFYCLVDASQKDGGPLFEESYRRALESGLSVQVLPLRVYSRRRNKKDISEKILQEKILGPNWRKSYYEIKSGADGLFTKKDETLVRGERGSVIYPSRIHLSILNQVGNNQGKVRMCFDGPCGSYCGACHMKGHTGTIEGKVVDSEIK
jgi:hypothetical protein